MLFRVASKVIPELGFECGELPALFLGLNLDWALADAIEHHLAPALTLPHDVDLYLVLLRRERFRHDRNDVRLVRRAAAHQRQQHD